MPPRIRKGRHKVAIVLTLIPYHGQAARDPKEIRRGRAKSGTTHFHCYATTYVIKKNKRVTLAAASNPTSREMVTPARWAICTACWAALRWGSALAFPLI